MADLFTKTCDGCGIIKKESDDWYKAFVIASPHDGLLIMPADLELPPYVPVAQRLDLCSHSCISKAVSRELSNGN